MYGAPFWQKLGTFIDTIFNFFTTSKYLLCDTKPFYQYNIYLYTAGTIFCKYVFLFCATLNIFNQHESSFGCHIIFFVTTTYFFVTHIILVRMLTSMWNIFFVDTTAFCATQHLFVLPNVSLKNTVNKEKQMCSH